MKSQKYHLYLTNQEYAQVINALIELKNSLLSEGKYTDFVDELIIKFSKAKIKKIKVVYIY